MNKKLFLVISLILYGFLQQNVAGNLNCGNKDAVACKTEFVKQLDLRFQEFLLNEMEKEIKDIVNVFNAVLTDLPENDEKAKMLKKSINELKVGSEKIKENRNDYENTRALISNMERNMQPHIMVQDMDKKSIADFEKLLDKYGYTKVLENFDFNEFIDMFIKMWIQLYVELRPSDIKELPAYSEINEKMMALSAEKDKVKREELIREVIIKVREFCKIPFLEEIIFYERKSSKKQ